MASAPGVASNSVLPLSPSTREDLAWRTYLWGPQVLANGRVHFRIWAPSADSMRITVGGAPSQAMQRCEDGWHDLVTAARVGDHYCFELPSGTSAPDPASRFQPNDVSGPSEVIDAQAYQWRAQGWRGRPWHEAVIYELHVGSFTPSGTFAEAIEKLPHLAGLGVTAVELMPIGDFPGTRNWGYDGVLPFAPESSYGHPDHLKAFVDAAHALGLMVLLDVVYNHFGPEGNWLPAYAKPFFTERHHTPWGSAINFDGKSSGPVRAFFIENARYWIEEFRLDGLRLDAVHAIIDDGEPHILDEIAYTVRQANPQRHIHLILENEANEAHRLTRTQDGVVQKYSAQWNDDLHHVLHAAATGESSGYYRDYHGDDRKLVRAIAEGFAFQGERMAYRGSSRGEPSAQLTPDAFVGFLQNHDQVGNRALGERLAALAPASALRAVTALYLLMPQIPMLFMGEEWGATEPFTFFYDFHGELADAVRKGRRAEFAHFPEFANPESRNRIPDPQAPETFLRTKLNWDALDRADARYWLAWYRKLLAVRRVEIVPRLARMMGNASAYEILGRAALRVSWRVGQHERLMLLANLNADSLYVAEGAVGRVIWQQGEGIRGETVAPWTVLWSVEQEPD